MSRFQSVKKFFSIRHRKIKEFLSRAYKFFTPSEKARFPNFIKDSLSYFSNKKLSRSVQDSVISFKLLLENFRLKNPNSEDQLVLLDLMNEKLFKDKTDVLKIIFPCLLPFLLRLILERFFPDLHFSFSFENYSYNWI